MEAPAEGASLAAQWAAIRLWRPGNGMRTGEWGQGQLVGSRPFPWGAGPPRKGRKGDLGSRTRDRTLDPAVKVQSLNNWTSREVAGFVHKKDN